MAYFLKKTKNKKGLYLQIYESHWDAGRGHTVNRSVRAIGYEHELREKGSATPSPTSKHRSSDLLEEMEALTGLPLGCFYLSKGQIGKILDCELK